MQNRECIRLCDDMYYWDPKNYRCKPVKKECFIETNYADLAIRHQNPYGAGQGSSYANIGDISRGYDLMIADPYNAIVSTFKQASFS